MKCRVLEKGNCEITQEYHSGHLANDIVGGGYTLDNVVAHSEGKIIFFQDGYNNMPGSTGNASYGNCVKIDHGNGYYTLYAHMQKGLLVKNGEYVKKGQVLGYMGNSGNANGAHLHFEVWKDGVRINPSEYLDKDLFTETIEKSIEELAREVIEGKYGNGEDRKRALGDRYSEVQARVNEILAPVSKPSVDILDLVKKTIRGDFGNGEDRKRALGDRYSEVQARVNEILAPVSKPSVDILDLVKKTIRGDFGNGEDRKNNLGSNYNEVQRQVNLNYQNGTINWNNIQLY